MTLRSTKDSFARCLAGRLTGMQSRLHALIVLAILLITANTVFLLVRRVGLGCAIGGEDRCTLSEFYQFMVLSHSGLRMVMAATIAVFLLWHLADRWRCRSGAGGALPRAFGTDAFFSGFRALLHAGGQDRQRHVALLHPYRCCGPVSCGVRGAPAGIAIWRGCGGFCRDRGA